MIKKNTSFFVRRCRSYNKKKKYLENNKEYIINIDNKSYNFLNFFDNKKNNILDIGFGYGNSLISPAKNFPNFNFYGVEIYIPGIISIINTIKTYNIKNIKIYHNNIYDILYNNIIPNDIFYAIQIFFPDPWHKRKHYKRRLINDNFIKEIKKKIIKKGYLFIKTDNYDYFTVIKNICLKNNFCILDKNIIYNPLKEKTKFQEKAINKIYQIIFCSL